MGTFCNFSFYPPGVLSYDVDCSIDVEQKCGKIENNWTGVTWPEDQKQLKKAWFEYFIFYNTVLNSKFIITRS